MHMNEYMYRLIIIKLKKGYKIKHRKIYLFNVIITILLLYIYLIAICVDDKLCNYLDLFSIPS